MFQRVKLWGYVPGQKCKLYSVKHLVFSLIYLAALVLILFYQLLISKLMQFVNNLRLVFFGFSLLFLP